MASQHQVVLLRRKRRGSAKPRRPAPRCEAWPPWSGEVRENGFDKDAGPGVRGPGGAAHIRELHIEILRDKPGTPEHTIRARLSEAVSDGLLNRLGEGFYDVYAEDEDMTSVVSSSPG